MEAYTTFAEVYDEFMDNIPYEEWCRYIISLLKQYNVKNEGIIAELGCGTGSITRILSKSGYNMIGIDNSEDMLSIARKKSTEDEDILYLLQDMREFELYGTVDAVISICDSMNYITDDEDMVTVLKLVNNYLEKDGIFIFDMNTEYKYRSILADNTFAENREECSFIWENCYDEEEMINEYALTLFIKEDEYYKKYEEFHYQRAYTIEKMTELIKESGMELIAVYDAFTMNKPTKTSERVYFVLKETYQKDKTYI
ncbi:MAG: class I SAM-dependent methyltransferase [Lachnospiraceae bacterium]|nr:class I SAM-dependent methyltransferase [Lachnospiraceae bacterium]